MYLSCKDVFKRLSKVLSCRLVINTALGCILVEFVECKHCTYYYDSGLVKNFFCSAYEYCCGPLCCRSRPMGFFQLWYFWLMIILMLMLCSGGGWWYKFRYRNHYRQGLPNVGVPNNSSGFRPFSYGPGQQGAAQYPAGLSYPANVGPYPSNMPGAAVYMPASMGGPYPMAGTPYPTQPMGPIPMPPPPYTGPPPSYAAATTGNPS